ncbi:MAG: hypothetical protein ABR569_04815 [Gaiellaceae bacterium]
MARERARSIDDRFAELETLLAQLRRDVAAAPRPKEASACRAAERWVQGLGWDETFTSEMVEDELGKIERRLHVELTVEERERLLGLWRELRAERFPAAA